MTRSTSVRSAAVSVFRQPSLMLAEIAWRWAFGAAAVALTVVALFTWLDSQVISAADELLLASGLPFFTDRAITHIFAGSVARLLRASAVLAPCLVLLWTLAAASGRAVVVPALVPGIRPRPRSLIGVSFLRAVTAMAAIAGFIGAAVVSSRIGQPAPPAAPRPTLGLMVLIALAGGVAAAWSLLNWFLAVAPLFAARPAGQAHTVAVLGATLRHFRDDAGKVFSIGAIFGVLHLAVWLFYISTAPLALVFAAFLPGWVTLALVCVFTLAYFAVVDALHLSRLAAHAALLPRG